MAEIKRASGRRMVRIAVAGDEDPSWLRELPGTTVIRSGVDYTELELDEGGDAEVILTTAREHGPVTRFELADPSVEAIFIEHVGRRPDEEERHLAAPPPGGGTPADPGPTRLTTADPTPRTLEPKVPTGRPALESER